MKNQLIAERYARGLNAAITDEAEVNTVARALRAFAALYRDNAELRNVLSNEAIRMEQRGNVLEEVLRKVEMPEAPANLCKILLRRHRITHLPNVALLFRRMADERMNQVRAKVVTAVELDEAQLEKIAASLEKFTAKKVKLDTDVDPRILGGVVAHLGSVVIDGSIKTRLERMRSQLLSME